MNNSQFDNIILSQSQQAANENAMPFNEEAWSKMELLLDKEKRKRSFIIWWWLLPILSITIGFVLFFLNTNKQSSTLKINSKQNNITTNKLDILTPKNTNPAKEFKNKRQLKKDTSSNNSIAILSSKKIESTTSTISKKVEQNTSVNVHQLVNNTKQNNGNPFALRQGKKANKSINKNPFNIYEQPTKIVDNTSVEDIATSTIQNSTIPAISNTKTENNSSLNTNKIDTLEKMSVNKVTDSIVVNMQKNTVDTTPKTVRKSTIDTTKNKLSKFQFSVFVAADISTVKFTNINKISSSFGVGFSYALSKKISLATGFAVSRKLYVADSADYKNQPTVPSNYRVKTILANCLVYEIPINIQYNFLSTKKSRWYAIAGLSTYLMKSEAYSYTYTWNGFSKTVDYTIENKNNQPFSILNVAIGYSKQLSKTISYQLTPFIKIPLTGIGEGAVPLSSAGLQLSINLNTIKRK